MTSNKIDSLTLMSGTSIPIEEAGLLINQPRIKDISMLGEKAFYESLSYLLVNKDKMSLEIEISDFDLFTYLCYTNEDIRKRVSDIFILTIEDIEDIQFQESFIMIKTVGHECIIDEPKFFIIKEIYKQIFCLEAVEDNSFNPVNDMARQIAEKLKKRKEKLSGQKVQQEQTIFSNFISILTIGSGSLNISDCLNMTVFQIYNLIKRFNLYTEYSMQMQALMQGAENIELVEWTKQI